MTERDGEDAKKRSSPDRDLIFRARIPVSFERHQPLYERVPTRDTDGHPLSDFMMLIPGLRDRPGHQFKDVLARIQAILAQFREVVFVDLNVPLNLLWVSVRAKPGIILDIACSVKFQVPEALLVAHKNTP